MKKFSFSLSDLYKDSFIYGLAEFLQKGISFFLLPLYTRYLNPEDYGVLALLTIISTILPPIASLGLPNAIFREVSLKSKDKDEVFCVGFVTIFLSALFLVLISISISETICKILIGSLDSGLIRLVNITLLTSFFICMYNVPKLFFRAQRRAKLTSVLNLTHVILSISVSLLLVVYYDMKLSGVVYANFISIIISTILNYIFVYKYIKIVFDFSLLRRMLYYGLPIVPSRIQGFGIIYFGQYMVNNNFGLIELGLYSIAMKICTPFNVIVQAVHQAWVPLKFHIYADSKYAQSNISHIVKIHFLSVALIWLLISINGPLLIELFIPEKFHSASKLVPFLAFVPLCNSIYNSLSSGFGITDKTLHLPLVNFLGLISIIFLTTILIKNFGIYGVAVASSISWVIMAMAIYYISQKQYKIDYNILSFIYIIFISLMFYIIYVIVLDLKLLNIYIYNFLFSVSCILSFKIIYNIIQSE